MIHVEKKVTLTEEALQKIETLGTYLSSSILTDTYFDTEDFRYTTSDIWLRERDCKFELKVCAHGLHGEIDHYEEIKDEKEILQKLGLEKEKKLLKALSKVKIYPYASFQTVRRKYRLEEFTIDLDLAYFDDFIYRIADIELIVSNESKLVKAEKDLSELIKKLGLSAEAPLKAKLVEFLLKKNPAHYQALLASGVVK